MSKFEREDLVRAMEAIQNGQMSQRKAVERFEVRLSTLDHTINQKYVSNGADRPSFASSPHTEDSFDVKYKFSEL